jgi:uncharacterized protein YdaU (DUF1376 family)
MNYYQFNIGDYRRDTTHLSRLEHSIYRDLIDWYYLDESPIPLETQVVMRRLRLVSGEEAEALQSVLNDFFLASDGWRHARIDADISAYHDMAEKNRINGKLGGRPKKTHSVPIGMPNESQNNPNQEPITNNQEPIVTPTSLRDVPPSDSAKQKSVTLSQWMAGVHERGEKLMSDYTPLNEYTEKVGLPADWVELAWIKFKDRHTSDEKAKRKRYTNWRLVFKRAVEENWMKLWFFSEKDQKFRLSTVGVSADLATREAA